MYEQIIKKIEEIDYSGIVYSLKTAKCALRPLTAPNAIKRISAKTAQAVLTQRFCTTVATAKIVCSALIFATKAITFSISRYPKKNLKK